MTLQEQDILYMQRCIQLARCGREGAAPNPMVGAVIVCQGHIIGEGYHIRCGGPHAEVNAIRAACKQESTFSLKGCVVYSSCEPCPMCLSALYWAGVSRIYYGNTQADADKINFSDQFIYRELDKPKAERMIPCIHMPNDESILAFQKWEAKPDKVEY